MRIIKNSFISGYLICMLMVGCAGVSFRYYGLKDASYTYGTLLGPKDTDDLAFSKCAPTQDLKNPCVVMFASEFFELKRDYERLKLKVATLCAGGK